MSAKTETHKERPILFSAPMVRAILAGQKTQTRRVLKQATGPSLSVGMADDAQFVAELSWLHGDGPGYDVEETIRQVACPYGQPGDRLWVRETCRAEEQPSGLDGVRYLADSHFEPIENSPGAAFKWMHLNAYRAEDGAVVPSIHMPRWASRILLEVVSVRAERLQDISEADADAEGCERLEFEREERDWKICHQCGGTRLHSAMGGNGGVIFDCDCRECDTYVKRYRHLWESINGNGSWNTNPWVWVVEFERIEA